MLVGYFDHGVGQGVVCVWSAGVNSGGFVGRLGISELQSEGRCGGGTWRGQSASGRRGVCESSGTAGGEARERHLERSKCFRPPAPQVVGHGEAPPARSLLEGGMSMCAPF